MKRAYKVFLAVIFALSLGLFVSCGSSDCSDKDGDGFGDNCDPGIDCNDDDSSVYPNAPELCDNKEHRCPGDWGYGRINEGCGQ